MYPHVIRLRGPWQLEPLCRYLPSAAGTAVTSIEKLPPAGRATVPGDWGAALGRDFRGRARYRRTFHAPATLDRHERLWLVVEGVDARGVASVNGFRLGEIENYVIECGFDITTLISHSNEVTIEVEVPLDAPSGERALRPGRERLPGGPIREVRLEVRSQWFIDELAVWSAGPDGTFFATGRIGGNLSQARMAVVIGGCQRELAYLEALPGEQFKIDFAAKDFPVWSCASPNRAGLEVKLLGHSLSVWQKQIETAVRTPSGYEGTRLVKEVLSEGDYRQFDRAGVAIVQQIPPAWADRVCPRLAHHPAIMAWAAPENAPAGLLCGRPWLPSDTPFLLQPD